MTSTLRAQLQKLKQDYQNALFEQLQPEGFCVDKNSFVLSSKEGFWSIGVLFIDFKVNREVGVRLGLSIRYDEIESWAVDWRQDLSMKDKARSVTISSPIERWYEPSRCKWNIGASLSPEIAAKEFAKNWKELCLPFFERFSQLPQLLAAFSSIERKNWMQTDFGRAVRLPIVQALLGQTQEAKISLKSMFEQLVSSPQQAIPVNIEQYRVFMKTFEQRIFHDS